MTYGVDHLDKPSLLNSVATAIYPRHLLFLSVQGSYRWGTATDESDVDLRFVYAEPTANILKVSPPKDTIETTFAVHGALVDVQGYEVRKTLNMLLVSNGNIFDLLSSTSNVVLPHPQLRDAALSIASKKLANYYLGYATSQRKRAMQNRGAKALAYTYREIFAGIFFFTKGRVAHDFAELWAFIEQADCNKDLLRWALANRHTPVTDTQMDTFLADWDALCILLSNAVEASCLPASFDHAATAATYDALLLEMRKEF